MADELHPYAIKLKTGRVMEPSFGVIGISKGLGVYEGYDNDLRDWNEDVACMQDREALSPGEKIEVCDIMIDRWTRLRAQLSETK